MARKISVTSTGYDPALGRQVKDPTLESLDLDAIEATCDASPEWPFVLRDLCRAVRERDAEIARLIHAVELAWRGVGDTVRWLCRAVCERDEEIARLRAELLGERDKAQREAIEMTWASAILDAQVAAQGHDAKQTHWYPTAYLSGRLDAARDVRALAAKPASAVPEWRHQKRGTTYVERDRGELQLSTDHVLKEGDRIVSYRGTDGRTWFRYEPEFDDGRFERVAAKPGSET